jgi:predicted aspartyl protease
MRGRSYCWLTLLTVLLVAGEPAARGYTHGQHGQEVRFDLYYNYLIVVRGSAGPLKGLNFLLDTGASPSVLDRRLAQKLHLQERPANVAVLNGSATAGRTILPSLELGPVRRDNLDVLTEDLWFIQKSLPVHIDAIVGLDVLGQSPFEIDYTSREIRFGPLPLLANSLPFRIWAGIPIVNAELNNFSVHLMVDTGAPSLVLFKARTPSPVSPVKIGSVQQSADTIGEVDRKRVRLQSVRLGEAEFGKMPVFMAPSRSDEIQEDFDGLMSPAALGITKISVDLGRGVLAFSR